MSQSYPIVVFDGDCEFCNRSVQFILDHEKEAHLRFAHLQDSLVREKLEKLSNGELKDSIYLLDKGVLYYYSDAGLRICTYLKQPYSYLNILRYIPRYIRDWGYRLIAKNRKMILQSNSDSCDYSTELRNRMKVNWELNNHQELD